MFEITTFLAQLWGPVFLILGMSMVLNRSFYVTAYRRLETENLTLIVVSLLTITAGIAQITYHNVWNTLPEIIISVLGWALLIKGAALALFPRVADRWGDSVANSKLLHMVGGAAGVLGLYLTVLGYF